MDLNDLFITLVLVNCVWLLSMRPERMWVVKSTVMLAVLGGIWRYWDPQRAGEWTVSPWAALILIPMWLQHWTIRLMQQRRVRLARCTAAVLSVLHPAASVKRLRQSIRVLALMYRGQVAESLALAEELGLYDSSLRTLGSVINAQMTGHWEEFERRLSVYADYSWHDASLLAGRVQSLTERGDWDELARVCQVLGQSSFSEEQSAALSLRVFAVLGDITTAQKLLLSSGHLIARETREYWLAVGEQVSGASDRASQRLTRLQASANPTMLPMIARRLTTPISGPPESPAREQAVIALHGLKGVIDHNSRYAVLSGRDRRWSVMTLLLALALVGMYFREIPGGSEDADNLVRLGALELPLLEDELDWKFLAQRVLASGFLHFGPLHLGFNLLGLLFLGRMVERAFGSFWMLVHFLTCIMVSGCLLPWLTILEPGEIAVFAGASGGIMGLLGGLWGLLLVGRLRLRTPLVQSQFRVACSFIVIQSVCDIMTPKISMTCHLLGLGTGIIGGILMGLAGGRRLPKRSV